MDAAAATDMIGTACADDAADDDDGGGSAAPFLSSSVAARASIISPFVGQIVPRSVQL